ncbi:hypothetical protein HZH66_012611 [Vespula vulgaris]|uniref:Uncharacterized protein n=1 Tax=Vespula vulgaris TaxID=7454 RepID=A0A834JEW6_VESVU|nr:hypothetical protein HZH66_012611 [Vespula vulgaris]
MASSKKKNTLERSRTIDTSLTRSDSIISKENDLRSIVKKEEEEEEEEVEEDDDEDEKKEKEEEEEEG